MIYQFERGFKFFRFRRKNMFINKNNFNDKTKFSPRDYQNRDILVRREPLPKNIKNNENFVIHTLIKIFWLIKLLYQNQQFFKFLYKICH